MNAKTVVSVVLGIAGMIGLVTTAVFCAKETPEADAAFEEEKRKFEEMKAEENKNKDSDDDIEDEEEEEIGIVTEMKVKAPHYKKTLIAGGITLACIASGQIVSLLALTSAVGGLYAYQSKYHNLDDAVRKMKNNDLYQKVRNNYAKTSYENGDAKEVNAKGLGKMFHKEKYFKIYEPETDQVIETTTESIANARAYMAQTYGRGDFVSLNKTVKMLGGCPVNYLKDYGWCIDDDEQYAMLDNIADGTRTPDIKIDMGSTSIVDDGKTLEMLCVWYNVPPKKLPLGGPCLV